MKDQYKHLQIMLSDSEAICQTAVQTSSYIKEENLHPLSTHMNVTKTTFDCGVQTNMPGMDNPEADITGLDQLMVKKRQKRKQYKKRKKQQKKMAEKQNKQQFKQIIDLFYEREAKFEDYEDRLEQLVCSFNQSDFKNIFDSILKQRVAIIQNSIWEYTQAILQQDPRQMKHDHPFYLEMVDQMYKYYKLIERSSFEAEKVIYIYLSLNSKQTDEPITPQDLGRRTFRYLVQMDDTLKKLLNMCDKKITLVRVVQRQKLQIMISKLKNFRQRSENILFDEQYDSRDNYYQGDFQGQQDDEDQQDQEEQQEDQKSTAMSQNSQQFYEENQQQQKNMMMRRKKKKRVLEGFQEDQEKCYNFLENLVIDKDNRLECNVQYDFSEKIMSKMNQKMQKSFKKQTEFDVLVKRLTFLEPIRQVSVQFKRMY